MNQFYPQDHSDEFLISNVRPTDWVNPVPKPQYDLVVIGAGAGGLVSSVGAAGLGASVAIIEAGLLGGDCLNFGCVPSKALLKSAKVANLISNAEQYGISNAKGEVNFGEVMKRMRALRAKISPHDAAQRFKDLGIDVFLGKGVFTGKKTIQVKDAELKFARAIIATGGKAFVPPIPGLKEAGYLTNESLFGLNQLPEKLTIVGGGPIGCEMALALSAFGSDVTLIEGGPKLLGPEPDDASAIALSSLKKAGVRVLVNSMVKSVNQERVVSYEQNGMVKEIASTHILVATGRRASTSDMGLEEAGVTVGKRGIVVDDRLRTSNKRIFAVGDVASKWQFTHAADEMARMVIRNAWFFGRAKHSKMIVPRVTYLNPEIASVGDTSGEKADIYEVKLSGVDRSILEEQTEGFVKVFTKEGSDKIVGASVVAPAAGEMLGEVTLAMQAGVGLATFSATMHAYPTVAAAFRSVGDAYSKTRLTPFVAKLLRWVIKRRS